mgnify:CR=1 FL=1
MASILYTLLFLNCTQFALILHNFWHAEVFIKLFPIPKHVECFLTIQDVNFNLFIHFCSLPCTYLMASIHVCLNCTKFVKLKSPVNITGFLCPPCISISRMQDCWFVILLCLGARQQIIMLCLRWHCSWREKKCAFLFCFIILFCLWKRSG